MDELIKINNKDGKQLVSARELYLGLGLNKSNWSRWYPTNIINNGFFNENTDYIGVRHYDEGNNEIQDFAITLEFAKHIAMMARTEKSHEYRNYFIDCEAKAKQKELDTTALSPELQMFNSLFNALAKNELEQKRLGQAIEDTKQEIQGIRDIVALNPNSWRKDTSNLISKMALAVGGFDHIKQIREESYKLLDERFRVDVDRRLLNKRKAMALEGASKSKINKANILDVIDEDPKLREGYIAIIKEMAIKYGVSLKEAN